MDSESGQIKTNPIVRVTLLASGFGSLALGVLGIFLPLLPTVPLLFELAAPALPAVPGGFTSGYWNTRSLDR